MQVESKNYCMVMRTESLGAILATSIEPNLIIWERFTQPLHEELPITLTQRQGLLSLTSLWISIVRNRDMIFIVGQRDEICGIMIL